MNGSNLPILTRGLSAHTLCREAVAGLAARAMLRNAPVVKTSLMDCGWDKLTIPGGPPFDIEGQAVVAP